MGLGMGPGKRARGTSPRLGFSSDSPRRLRFRHNPPNIEAIIYLDDSPSMLLPAEVVGLVRSRPNNKQRWDLLLELKEAGKIRGVDWDQIEGSAEPDPNRPPKMATLLVLLIPKKNREHILGDLDEEYRTILMPRYGRRTANLWYWWQAAISVGPLLWAKVKRGLVAAWLWHRVH